MADTSINANPNLPQDMPYAPLAKSSLCAPTPLFSDKRALIDRHYIVFLVAFATSASVAGVVTASQIKTSWDLGQYGIGDDGASYGVSGKLTQSQTSLGPDGIMNDDHPFLIKSASVMPKGLPYAPTGNTGAGNAFVATAGGNVLATFDRIAEPLIDTFYANNSAVVTTGGDCPQNLLDLSSYAAGGGADVGGSVPSKGMALYANVQELPFYLRVLPSQIKQKALKFTIAQDSIATFSMPDSILPPSAVIVQAFKLELAGRLLCGADDGDAADPNGKRVVDAATPRAGTMSGQQMAAFSVWAKANGVPGF